MSYTSRVYRHRNAHTHENDNDNDQSRFFTKADKQSAAGKGKSTFFQAKLTVNQPGDRYEQEADSVANAVVNKSSGMPAVQQKEISSVQRLSTSAADEEASTDEERMRKDKMVQRKCAHCEEEEKQQQGGIQKKDEGGNKKEEEEDQAKSATVQRKADGNSGTSAQLSSRIEQSAGNGNPLPSKTQAEMQESLGYDLGAVNIHADAEAADLSRQVKAQAFTHGKDIYFNAGKYSPESSEGKHLLAHELTHVIQQNEAQENDIQRMLPCPAHLDASDPLPDGFKDYYGPAGMFHCGYRGILEDRLPTPSDPQNECFYDETGTLVDNSHPFAGCRGTPNSYDSSTSWWDHFANDPGGIWQAGWDAFWTSRGHDQRDSDWGTERHRYPDGTYYDEEGNMHMGPGPKY